MKSIILGPLLWKTLLFCGITLSGSCQSTSTSERAKINSDHPNPRMHFYLVDSEFSDATALTKVFDEELKKFGQSKYEALKPLILDKDIPTIQRSIRSKKLSYRELTLFFLYRIQKYESNPGTRLNAIIALHPDALQEAERCDRIFQSTGEIPHEIFGMPILVKDNIGVASIPTTAGAVVLADHRPGDAFIIQKLKSQGAIILGKTNLSEWAYYFCTGCPLGYSAVGGQSLNPHGRFKFETGGSSSGSGTAIAAQYAIAAIGTETSGSILSPASLNSIVGLKPTVGLLSRSGIVPISSTLDTPGPMTKFVVDNLILLEAMEGQDSTDPASFAPVLHPVTLAPKLAQIQGKRMGIFDVLKDNPNFQRLAAEWQKNGGEVVYVSAELPDLNGFLSILNLDMRRDIPAYFDRFPNTNPAVGSIEEIIAFNEKSMEKYAPYGQRLFELLVQDTTSEANLLKIKQTLKKACQDFFNETMIEHKLSLLLSMNNAHAAVAALAHFPAITVPIGAGENGEPQGATIIMPGKQESDLLYWAGHLELLMQARISPMGYRD